MQRAKENAFETPKSLGLAQNYNILQYFVLQKVFRVPQISADQGHQYL